MAIVVNNNISSLIAQRNLSKNSANLTKSIEKLSSGFRINKAADDAAGLSISESLRGQIRGNNQAINNIQNGINLLQIAEGGLAVVTDNIQRIRELCIQAANDTNATSERDAVLTEINARLADVNRIAKSTKFNNINLLDGSATSTKIQIGANSTVSTNTIDISNVLKNAEVSTLGLLLTGISGTNWSSNNIRSYLSKIDSAVQTVLKKRGDIGALQNRLESALDNLTVMNENIQSSESRIRDVDIAKETANMTKYQILQQASASILSQANQIPQLALSLLQG